MSRLRSIEEIYEAKAQRRKELAALPIGERVRIIEKLRDFAVQMREVKRQMQKATTI